MAKYHFMSLYVWLKRTVKKYPSDQDSTSVSWQRLPGRIVFFLLGDYEGTSRNFRVGLTSTLRAETHPTDSRRLAKRRK
jgi:hypothetical protein